MTWVVEMTGVRMSDAVQARFLFCMGPGLALTDDIYAEPGLMNWASPSQSIDIGKTGMVSTMTDAGSFEILNAAPTIDQAGPWDSLLNHVWNAKQAKLWWVPGYTMAAATLMGWGVMEQPVGNILGGSSQATIKFPLRDTRSQLEAPFQPNKFLGTNVGPVGVEGGADLKGRPKPILYGTASNIPAPRVNESLLIYQVADAAVSILCVRDGGVALTAGVVRGTLASLQANAPGGGKYDTFSDATGTYFRLGSKPIFGITVDASEGANIAARSHADIWNRIRQERCSTLAGAINTASVTAARVADPGEAGFWWPDETTDKEVLDEVLSSFGAFEVYELAGTWKVQKLVLPSGTSVVDFMVLGPSSSLVTKSRPLSSLQRLRPGYAPNGVPPYRVTARWGRNYKVMSASEFAGNAVPRLKDKFSSEWRLETQTNNAVWNPTASTGLWPNAPELTIDTGYQPGADGFTSTDAATEASRVLTMFSTLRGQYQLSFIPEISDRILPGDVVKLTHASMGLSGGKLFCVLQAALLVGTSGAEMDLVLGLES